MKRNRNVAILFFTMIVVMMGLGIIIPIMPFYVESFGAGGTELGMLMAIFSIMQFLLMLGAHNLTGVMLTVAFIVFANAMLRPAIASLISKKAEGGQGMAMGMNNAFQSLGRIVGPLWAGWLFDVHINFPYWSAAFIMFGSFLASLVWLPADEPAKANAEPESSSAA